MLICVFRHNVMLAGVEKFWRYHSFHGNEIPFFVLIYRLFYFFRFDNDTHIPFHLSAASDCKATI